MPVEYNRGVTTPSLEFQLKRSIQLAKERNMKKAIEVRSKDEGNAIQRGLQDPVLRAIAVISGELSELTPQQRDRVLEFVQETAANAPEA